MTDEDDQLREDFARQRRIDARQAPPFEAMKARPKVRPLRPAVLAAFPLVAAAAALVVVSFGAMRSQAPAASAPAAFVPSASPIALAGAGDLDAPLPLEFLLRPRAASADLRGTIAGARGAFDSDFLLSATKTPRGHEP